MCLLGIRKLSRNGLLGSVQKRWRSGSLHRDKGFWATIEHHDPVTVSRHTPFQGKRQKTASVSVPYSHEQIMFDLLSSRLGLKKFAFLQEREDWLSAAFAK